MLRTVEMAAAAALERGLDIEVKAVDDLENEAAAVEVAKELVADASVIACAERSGGRVLTLDLRDFGVVARAGQIRILPD